MVQAMNPSRRKLAAIAALLASILGLAALVAPLAHLVGNWPVLAQPIFYGAAGLA